MGALFRPPDRAEIVVILVALLFRALYFVDHLSSVYFDHPVLDALWIHQWAESLAAGVEQPARAYFRAPLYPYFVAGLYDVFGVKPWVVAAVQHLLGALSAGLVVRLGRCLFDGRVGVVAGLLYAMYWLAIFFEGELLIVTLATWLGLLALTMSAAVADVVPRRARVVGVAVAGLALGLAAIARPTFLVLTPLVLFWPLVSERLSGGSWGAAARSWRLAIFAGAFALAAPIATVTARNVVVGGDLVVIAAQGGLNLYVGNGPGADGKTARAPGEVPPQARETYTTSFRDNVTLSGRYLAEAAMGRDLRESEISAYWLEQTLAHVADHPAASIIGLWRKLSFLINGFEINDNRSLDLAMDEDRSLLISFVRLTWLLPLAACGFVIGLVSFRRSYFIVSYIILYGGVVVLFFVNARFRLPLVPGLAILAALAIVELVRRAREGVGWKRWLVPLGALAAGCVATNVRPYGIDDRAAASAHALNHAFLLLEQGRCEASIAAYESLRGEADASIEPIYQLARAYERCDDLGRAAETYRETIARWPSFPYAYLGLGRVLQSMGEAAVASAVYVDGLRALPDSPELLVAHASLMARGGQLGEAAAAYARAVELDPRQLSAWLNYGYTLLQLGRLESAASAFSHVQTLNPPPQEARAAAQGLSRVRRLVDELRRESVADPEEP